MAIDGTGKFIIGNKLDETGLMVFPGNFNEYGNYAAAGKFVTVILTEAVRIVDSIGGKTFTRNLTETVHVADNLLRTVNRTFVEPVAVSINTSRQITRTITTNVLISVGRQLQLTRDFNVEVHITDTFKRYFRYIFEESVNVSASLGNIKFTRNINVPLHITDTLQKTVSRLFVETVSILDILNRKRIIILIESIHISDSLSRSLTRVYTVNVSIAVSLITSVQFVMKKLYSKARGLYRGSIIKIEDGRDVK